MKKEIETYLNNIDLDIRKTGNARFFDQKVQPDVLSAVCECILECIDEKTLFTVNNIRYCEYSNELVTEIFNKPEIKKADNEYDKFFAQPLKMLAYCGLLSESKKGKSNAYKIVHKSFIEYIALRDRNAYYFLSIYLEKVLRDSELWQDLNNFFTIQDKSSLYELRNTYTDFIINNTPINRELEPIRILNPMLNILAFRYKKLGTKSGNIGEINYNDLLYNRVNWRDIKKDKSITREAFSSSFIDENIDNIKSYAYYIEKTKKFVKSIHPYSEVHRFENYPATQAHHIFLASQFPELADTPENIIAITPNQHFYRAHPSNNTTIVDKSYQAICLISKLDTIEYDYQHEQGNYSKESFIDILNTGLDLDISYTIEFEQLKHTLIKHFI